MSCPLKVNITIPTYNREESLHKAVQSALAQAYGNFTVLVVDDGSTDGTWQSLQKYADTPNLCALRLGRNLGTAQAKNVALLLADFEAISFHDSDDIAHEEKLLLQTRAMCNQFIYTDEILDWKSLDVEVGVRLQPDVVVGAYRLVKMDGSCFHINKRISLLDDFFPNLQFPSKTSGDWCLINAGLFRRSVFETLGGYLNSIEEDRELRNRTIAAGCLYYFVEQALLTKVEMADSLTIREDTGFTGRARLADREEVWRRNEAYRSGLRGKSVASEACTPIDLPDLVIDDVINPQLLMVNDDFPLTKATLDRLERYRGLFSNRGTATEAAYG